MRHAGGNNSQWKKRTDGEKGSLVGSKPRSTSETGSWKLSEQASPERRRGGLGGCGQRGRSLEKKKSKLRSKTGAARDMRQKGSNYRCCLPALAGFARPPSAHPDGANTMRRFLGNSTSPSGIFSRTALASDRSPEEFELAYSERNATLFHLLSRPAASQPTPIVV